MTIFKTKKKPVHSSKITTTVNSNVGSTKVVSKKAKNKFSTQWLHSHINDPYVKKAQNEGYRARAAYKLMQINEQFQLIRPGMNVVDLGASPGSWCQVLRKLMSIPAGEHKGKLSGTIIALDLLPMKAVDSVHFIQGDFREEELIIQMQQIMQEKQHGKNVSLDLVVSDMAHNLTGIASADMAQMQYLIELAVDFSLEHLNPKGALVVKAFHGSGFSQLIHLFKQHFLIVKEVKPGASRPESSETFIVGKGLKVKK